MRGSKGQELGSRGEGRHGLTEQHVAGVGGSVAHAGRTYEADEGVKASVFR